MRNDVKQIGKWMGLFLVYDDAWKLEYSWYGECCMRFQVWIRRLFLHIRRRSGHNQTVSEEKTQEKLSQPHQRTNEPNRAECKRDCSSYFVGAFWFHICGCDLTLLSLVSCSMACKLLQRQFRSILKELRCTWKCCKGWIRVASNSVLSSARCHFFSGRGLPKCCKDWKHNNNSCIQAV